MINKAVHDYHEKSGKYVRDLPTLSAALAEQDFDLSKLKDRWNRDYKIEFKVSGRNYQIVFRSLRRERLLRADLLQFRRFRCLDFEY